MKEPNWVQQMEDEIITNFPTNDTLSCDNCGGEVYILNEFTRLPTLLEELGKEKFIEWVKDYEIEIEECKSCYHTLFMSESHPKEMTTIKKFILEVVEKYNKGELK